MANRPGNPSFKKGQLPPTGRQWKAGESGNPKGNPCTLSHDLIKARKLSQVEFEKACGKLFFMSKDDLQVLIADGNTNVLELLVARILAKGISEASKSELNYFVERFLGKVPDNHNITTNLNGSLTEFIANRTRELPASEPEDEE